MNIRNGIENSNLTRASGAAGEVAGVARPSQAAGVRDGSAPAGNDQARVSAAATQLSQTLPADGGSSDVRTAVVQRVQSALAAGTYNVSASQVAGKLMQSMMVGEQA